MLRKLFRQMSNAFSVLRRKKRCSFHLSEEMKTEVNTAKNRRLICPICWEWISSASSIRVLECGHVFHEECEEMWRTGSCSTTNVYMTDNKCVTCKSKILLQPYEPCNKCSKVVLSASLQMIGKAMEKRQKYFPLQNTC